MNNDDDTIMAAQSSVFIDFHGICELVGPLGQVQVRSRILKDSRFPSPVFGGGIAGSKCIWMRCEVLAFFRRIEHEGFPAASTTAKRPASAVAA